MRTMKPPPQVRAQRQLTDLQLSRNRISVQIDALLVRADLALDDEWPELEAEYLALVEALEANEAEMEKLGHVFVSLGMTPGTHYNEPRRRRAAGERGAPCVSHGRRVPRLRRTQCQRRSHHAHAPPAGGSDDDPPPEPAWLAGDRLSTRTAAPIGGAA